MKATAPNLKKATRFQRDWMTPVLVLGGSANALSIARSLGRRGIPVNLSVTAGNHVVYSRFAKKLFPIPASADRTEFWLELFSTAEISALHGSVVFACNDEAVEFLAKNRPLLQDNFILDDAVPEIQLAMLDKKRTLEMAREIGIATPGFWMVGADGSELEDIEREIQYPALIKPIISHIFRERFKTKHFFVHSRDELVQRLEQVAAAEISVMVTELIPGPDNLLGSYYTYLDAGGKHLFHYTKKIIRRFPRNQGLACYHYTEWDEEIAELGKRFFTGIGFRGMGNIEFKRDRRDGKLKVIECNPRFTAAQELLTRSGMDISWLIYCHLTGLPVPEANSYQQGLHYWYPGRDFRAFRELSARKELTFFGWLRSIARRQVLPYFAMDDPLPSWLSLWREFKGKLSKAAIPAEP